MTRADYVRNLAEAIATDMFICMLNPKYRGPAFDYHTFDIEDWVVGTMGTSFPAHKPATDKEREQARLHARRIWNRWIKQAGDGIPGPKGL